LELNVGFFILTEVRHLHPHLLLIRKKITNAVFFSVKPGAKLICVKIVPNVITFVKIDHVLTFEQVKVSFLPCVKPVVIEKLQDPDESVEVKVA
jgi:hypothetical protein